MRKKELQKPLLNIIFSRFPAVQSQAFSSIDEHLNGARTSLCSCHYQTGLRERNLIFCLPFDRAGKTLPRLRNVLPFRVKDLRFYSQIGAASETPVVFT